MTPSSRTSPLLLLLIAVCVDFEGGGFIRVPVYHVPCLGCVPESWVDLIGSVAQVSAPLCCDWPFFVSLVVFPSSFTPVLSKSTGWKGIGFMAVKLYSLTYSVIWCLLWINVCPLYNWNFLDIFNFVHGVCGWLWNSVCVLKSAQAYCFRQCLFFYNFFLLTSLLPDLLCFLVNRKVGNYQLTS